MGDKEKKAGDDQKSKGDDKIQDEIIINHPENPNRTEGIKLVNFSKKGIFGRDGFLAALDLESSELLGSSSSSLRIIEEPTSAITDDGEDRKYQVFSGTAKKIKLSTGSDVEENCYAKDNTITKNNGIDLRNENEVCSLEEIVFSIDHILESILSGLDRETLLACRLVSLCWGYFASKALQEMVNILMVHKEREETPHYYFYAKKELYLEDLTALVSNSPEFPSTSFSFRNKNQGELNPSAQSFFEAHGSMIKKLTFDGWVSLSDVEQLLFTQAPNLEQLFLIHLRGKVHSKVMKYQERTENKEFPKIPHRLPFFYSLRMCMLGTPRSSVSPLIARPGKFNFRCSDRSQSAPVNYTPHKEKAETNGSRFDGSIIYPRPTLGNIKVFKCDAHIPQMFALQILEWCPNLVEVELPVEYFYLLIKPKNRLHLLKKVNTDILKDTSVEALKGVAKHHENNLTLEEIQFGILRTSYSGDLYSKAVNVVSKIFKASSATCQKLTLDYCFDLNMVCRMPQLKSLSFYDYERCRSPLNLFGEWSSMGIKFPALRTLNIRILASPRVDTLFGGPVSARVLSVKDVYFSHSPQEIVLQRFKEMFPNATLHPFTLRFENETETFDMMIA